MSDGSFETLCAGMLRRRWNRWLAALALAGLLAASPAHAFEPPAAKSAAVTAATYGSLYGMAVVASSVTAAAISGFVPASQLSAATTFGIPLVMVAVMSNAVPWALANVPAWTAAQWDAWVGPPPAPGSSG